MPLKIQKWVDIYLNKTYKLPISIYKTMFQITNDQINTD